MLLSLEIMYVKSVLQKCFLLQPLCLFSIFFLIEPKTVEEEESNFSSPLMLWLQQEQKRKESITEKKPKKGLIFEISSDDGFQICAESIEGKWIKLGWLTSTVAISASSALYVYFYHLYGQFCASCNARYLETLYI